MKWIYHARDGWFPNGETAYQNVYLRPRITDKKGEEYEGLIIDIEIISLGFFIEEKIFTKEEKPEYFELFNSELIEKDYFFKFIDVPEESSGLYLNWATLYLTKVYDKELMVKWLKLYLAIMGYPCDEMVEGSYNDFADTNPIMQFFSLKNVKKFEDIFGKEWWKNENKSSKEIFKHQSDNDLIKKLLKEIKEYRN